jgi:ribose/xylose/arabinose/galactoside ABC-type transport system permease subunit/ABC-type multidrug transport system ATPase subunit
MISASTATAARVIRLDRRPSRLGGSSNRIGLAFLAVALVGFFELTAGGFATFGNADSILLNVFPLLLAGIAAGCLLISGNVDLSMGGSYALSAVVTADVAHRSGSTAGAVAAGLAVGVAVGLLNGTLVRYLSISPLIVTLGTASVFHGLAFVITDGTAIFGFPTSFTDLGREQVAGVPFQVWIALVVFAVISLVLMKTVLGLRTYAIGGNPDAAARNGINVDRHVTLLFVLSGVAVSLAGVLTTAQLGSGTANLGIGFELDVLTAVILGGVAFSGGSGKPIGIFVGILTIGILDAGMIFVGLADFYQKIAKGGILLLALAFDQYAEHRRRVRRHAAADPALPPQLEQNGQIAMGRLASQVEPPPTGTAPVFRCEGLSKQYGAAWATYDVGFSVHPGEILCLLGDNGAGKSTLIKMVTGVQQPDSGEMWLNERPYAASSPRAARKAGVAAVFQDLALCPNLGAAYNLVLGDEPRRGRLGTLSLIDNKRAVAIMEARLDRLGVTLRDPFLPVEDLSGGQKQSVAIARVAADDVDLVILDEPTAALGVSQTRNVLELTRGLADRGAAVVMISHDVDNVLAIADRIVVLHLGRVLFEGSIEEVDQRRLVHLMAGIRDDQAAAEAAPSAPHESSAPQ